MRRLALLIGVAVALALILVATGCGGGGAGGKADTGKGSLSITVKFPPRPDGVTPAAIPVATNSFRIRITNPATGDELVPDTIISRSAGETQTVRIPGITEGDVKIEVFAYESYDGTGEPIAQAEVLSSVTQGEVTTVHIALGLLPHHVVVTPDPLDLEKTTEGDLIATVYDADDNVLVGSFTFDWAVTSVTPGSVRGASVVATVDSTGHVVAVEKGSCTVTATETGSGKSGDATVNVWVRTPYRAEIDPSQVSLEAGTTDNLTATAYDIANDPIPYATVQTWSSTDEAIAKVTGSGNSVTLDAVDKGDAIITADFGGPAQGTCQVHVTKTGDVEIIIE